VIDHVSVAVRDLAASTHFYEAVLAPLGFDRLESRPATVGFGKAYPEFWINLRAAMGAVDPANGGHIGFRARTANMVDAFHAAALAAGGSSDGVPGFRPQHGDGYYAAFIRDLDGNRIEAVTFTAKE
jgi:catechol 2,3-dioxygenase-like lactoylglutathione lyase family enzyme